MISRVTYSYFAYGSNMSTRRLQNRVASARPLGIGQLKGHALRWHKRSQDGSGKCDVEATRVESEVVWGVIFEIRRSEKYLLDQAEGLHAGYEEKEGEILTDRGVVQAKLYYATDLDPSRIPYPWYKAFVVTGARQHGLPASYVRGLEQVPTVPDPDASRAAMNARILSGNGS